MERVPKADNANILTQTKQKMIYLKQQSAKKITYISLGALILGHLMIPTNLPISFIGFLLTATLVYYFTLGRNDVFSFIMVIYFTNHFNYFDGYGGGFNIVAFLCVLFFFIDKKRMPIELRSSQKFSTILIYVFLLSSILGWSVNFAGAMHHLVISIISFTGIILLFIVTSSLYISKIRITIFLKISIILAFYSLLASANKYLNIIPFNTPMLPKYALNEMKTVVGGGVLSNSSIYGEQSMLMIILFGTYLLFSKNRYLSKNILYSGILLSFINVFFSISRSVFILSLVGLILIIIFQYKVTLVNIRKQVATVFLILVSGFLVLQIVNYSGLGFVFERLSQFDEQYAKSGGGGFSIDRIFDGSVFGRKESFDLGYDRYHSRDNWLIGYGWGTSDNNRIAFYVDTSTLQGTSHSQIFAVLFLFGWFGLFSYYGLYFYAIYKSFFISGIKMGESFDYRLFAFSLAFILLLFIVNEIKVDSISYQYYFGATIILLGLSFANINSFNLIKKH